MLYATRYLLDRVKLYLCIYCRKAFGEHCEIQIVINYEMKLETYFILSFLLNLLEYLVGMCISYTYKCLQSKWFHGTIDFSACLESDR